jgi:small nuclear ribonucleoprotein (snRNP)-like protein
MNRFVKIMLENEKMYEGQIKNILNEAKIKLSEAKDIYIEDRLSKYEKKIIEKAMKDVEAIQQDYLKTTSKLLDNEQYRMQNSHQITLSNTEKLLNEIRKSNELKLNELKIKAMTNEDIIQSCIENSSEAYVLQAKNELNLRASNLENKNEANELRNTARNLRHFTEQDELNIAKIEFEAMTSNKNLMPGVSVGERLAIGDIEEFLLRETKLQADGIAQATD